MTPPSVDAGKRAWRAWASQLEPVDTALVASIHERMRDFLDRIHGPVLGYVALPDELTCPAGTGVLPRLDDGASMTLHRAGAELETHSLGFAQPRSDAPSLDAGELAAVLVPGRVFDRSGYRLGRGGGHYDRLLSRLPAGVPVVGVTCTARVVDRLPREPHDIPMTHLADETGVHETNSTREPSDSDSHFVENGGGADLDS